MTSVQQFKAQDAIAYDQKLREQIENLHRALGTDITDVTSAIMELPLKFDVDSEAIGEELSGLIADLNIMMMQLPVAKDQSTPQANAGMVVDKLKELVQVLSKKLAAEAYAAEQNLSQWLGEAEDTRALMSGSISKITLALLGALDSKKELSRSEEDNQRGVQMLVEEASNFLFGFTQMVNDVAALHKHVGLLVAETGQLMDAVMNFINNYRVDNRQGLVSREVVQFLGNSEFEFNKLRKNVIIYQDIAVELQEKAYTLTKMIIDTQEKFRAVRASINDLGFFSENPKAASMYEDALLAQQQA